LLAVTRKVKPLWILLKQETVIGSGIGWAVCKSAHRSRQITMPAPNTQAFYRPDALPAAQPTSSCTEGTNTEGTVSYESSLGDILHARLAKNKAVAFVIVEFFLVFLWLNIFVADVMYAE